MGIGGFGDDVVYFGGFDPGDDLDDEVDAPDHEVCFLVGDKAGGVAVHMRYAPLGAPCGAVWAATVMQFEEGAPIPWPVRFGVAEGPDPYSVEVEVECPLGTPFVIKRARKGVWTWEDYGRFDGATFERVRRTT